MSDRPCSEWWPYGPCVISVKRYEDQRSKFCELFGRCMYAAPRESFTDQERELIDAWANNRVCLLVYRP